MSICSIQVHQDLTYTVDEEGFFACLAAAKTPATFFLPGLTSSLQSCAAQVRQIAAQTDHPVVLVRWPAGQSIWDFARVDESLDIIAPMVSQALTIVGGRLQVIPRSSREQKRRTTELVGMHVCQIETKQICTAKASGSVGGAVELGNQGLLP